LRGRRYADPVSHLDLLPTLRELLGLPAKASDQGRSLAGLLRGEVDALPETTHYISGNSRVEGFAAIVGEGHKLLLESGRARLYDLVADPGERSDVAAQKPELAARLRAAIDAAMAEDARRLAAFASRADAAALARAEQETLEALRELGYVEDDPLGAEDSD
jgi:arylsulfatase A-like enzyme